MRYRIRYTPGTHLARRFPHLARGASFPSREVAEELRRQCANAEHMEVVEVEDDA